jgi:hypothetical protein
MSFLQYWLDGIHSIQGPEGFAEPWDDSTFYKMPINAIVNIGYLIVALYWLLRRYYSNKKIFSFFEKYFFLKSFSFLSETKSFICMIVFIVGYSIVTL